MTGWDIRVVLHPLSLCGSTYSVQVAPPQYDLKLCRRGVKQIQIQIQIQILDFTYQRRMVPAFDGWQTSFAIPTYGHCHILRFITFGRMITVKLVKLEKSLVMTYSN